MANVKLIFEDECSSEGTYKAQLECFLNRRNCITIQVYDKNNEDDCNRISLDKSTAIKLAKTLRTEINKIQDDGNI